MTNRGPGRPPLQPGEVTIARGIRLLPDDWAAARKAAREAGQRGLSAGLRAIIAEWRELREQRGNSKGA